MIGCSFSFEYALLQAGIPVRHVNRGTNVPMYRTDVPCTPAGRFSEPLVVSMRPIPAALVPLAVMETARVPQVHGAPVHVGALEAAPELMITHSPGHMFVTRLTNEELLRS